MNTGFRTRDGRTVWIGWDEENGAYNAFAHEFDKNPCYMPSGRAFTVDEAIRALEADIVRAYADGDLGEGCEERNAALRAEFDVLIAEMRARL